MSKVFHFTYMHILGVGMFVGIWWSKILAEALCLILAGIFLATPKKQCFFWRPVWGAVEEDITFLLDLDCAKDSLGWKRAQRAMGGIKGRGFHVQTLPEEKHKYKF